MPSFASGRTCKASWAMPPTATPHASAMIGGSTCGATKIAEPMIERLRITGVNAGIANRRYTLSIPPASETSEMKST